MKSLEILSERLSSIKKQQRPLYKKNIVITGASRGIGLAIAKRCAQDGANIAILAKTIQKHPKLPGTIYTAAKQIQEVGGTALPLQCDIRYEQEVRQCLDLIIEKFGGIDILINNASAISLTHTLETSMKKYDLMHNINIRGTYMVSKLCLPYLLKSQNPHILTLAPPLILQKPKFKDHLAYTISKIGMSMCVHGMAEELKNDGVAVNAIWPKSSIATATINNFFGGAQRLKTCRKDTIMSDSAYLLLTKSSKSSKSRTGKFYFDQQILKQHGVTDLSIYQTDETDLQKFKTSQE